MLRVGLLALSLSACATAEAQAPLQPSETFAGLIGACWKADIGEDLAGGTITDTHCFSAATGGKVVMDVHKVRRGSGEVGYEGVTVYRLDRATGTIRFDYYNSDGDLITGSAKRDGQLIRFPETVYQVGEIAWNLSSNSYETVPLVMPEAKRRFVKVGPVPEGGF